MFEILNAMKPRKDKFQERKHQTSQQRSRNKA